MINNDRFYKTEMLLLSLLQQHDYSSEELTKLLYTSKVIQLKQGVVMTSLYFFLESHLISQYNKKEKVIYHIEHAGLTRLETLKKSYYDMSDAIENILNDIK
ncbi:hypothetical protein [Candidatus Stoquefichus sp. SB1]|jgi:DNA-binding PadR family transcriptional regulator|uniref:hypothetical protein n=1 Tax=Candidatus Stoquefichus sp. SB1 TaxID=1658109 RepID=UPI00067F46FD|nr:hypothetical protein [Candidatus Stoquefichus sp. SB1]